MEENINPKVLKDYVDILKNKEKKKEKKKKDTPFHKSIIMIIIGILISFLSQCELSLAYKLLGNYVNWNKTKIIISTCEFLIFFILSSIINKFKYTEFNIIYLIISILYTINSYIYYYGYSRNSFHFPNIANFWTFIIITIYNLFIFRNKLLRLPQFFFYGIFFGILGNIVQLLSAYYHIIENTDDEFQFIFFYSDHRNNILALLSGISSSIIYILMEIYLNKKQKIINSLPHIGFYSFIFCLIITIFKSEFLSIGSSFRVFPSNSLFYYFGLVILNIILLLLTPFYIHKCSALSYGIICSMEMSFKILIQVIFYRDERKSNIGVLFTLFFFIFSLGFILFEIIKDNSENEINNFIEKKDLIEKFIE